MQNNVLSLVDFFSRSVVLLLSGERKENSKQVQMHTSISRPLFDVEWEIFYPSLLILST